MIVTEEDKPIRLFELLMLRTRLNRFDKLPLLIKLIEAIKSANVSALQSELEPYHKHLPGLLPPAISASADCMNVIKEKIEELQKLPLSDPPEEEEVHSDYRSFEELRGHLDQTDPRQFLKKVESSLVTDSTAAVDDLISSLHDTVSFFNQVSTYLFYGVLMLIHASFEEQLTYVAEQLGQIRSPGKISYETFKNTPQKNKQQRTQRPEETQDGHQGSQTGSPTKKKHKERPRSRSSYIKIAEDYLTYLGYSFGKKKSARAERNNVIRAVRKIRNCIAHDAGIDKNKQLAEFASNERAWIRYNCELQLEITEGFLMLAVKNIDVYFNKFYQRNLPRIDKAMEAPLLKELEDGNEEKKAPTNQCDPWGRE